MRLRVIITQLYLSSLQSIQYIQLLIRSAYGEKALRMALYESVVGKWFAGHAPCMLYEYKDEKRVSCTLYRKCVVYVCMEIRVVRKSGVSFFYQKP